MIVVAGEALIDLIVRPDGTVAAVPGGGPFNTARTVARLGGEVAFLGRLSADRFGARLRDALAADGVDVTLVETTDLPTTLAIAEIDEAGVATYRFHTAETSAAGLSPAAATAALEPGPDAVLVGALGLALDPVADVLAAGVEQAGPDTLVMVDPNCRPAVIRDRAAYLARLDRVLARADVVKASTDDLAWLAPGTDPLRTAEEMLTRGPSIVLLTDGDRPVRVLGRDLALEAAVPRVDVVDTVGAGDAFGGAFLARWAELELGRAGLADRAALADATERAAAVSALTCTRAGADPPTRTEAGWPPR